MELVNNARTLSLSDDYGLIIIEPFYGGSHKVFVDTIRAYLSKSILATLPDKKWHWRARCGALMIYTSIPTVTTEEILLCSSTLNLAELLGIRPDLQRLKKIVYFHENQLVYPVRSIKDRDIQYAYNQLITCLAADLVLFNSNFNRSSFLNNIQKVVKMFPDFRPKHLKSVIEPKCKVLYFPVQFPKGAPNLDRVMPSILHIVWPHRWEFDKGPNDFAQVLYRLKQNDVPFKVSVLGPTLFDTPVGAAEMQDQLSDELVQFGHVPDRNEYLAILRQAHVVVSTAKHEFFGVAIANLRTRSPGIGNENKTDTRYNTLENILTGRWYTSVGQTRSRCSCCLQSDIVTDRKLEWRLEATYCGCFPLVPNDLVYPEIYPSKCLYKMDSDELYESLKRFCLNPALAIEARKELNINFDQYSVETIMSKFKQICRNILL